MLIEWQAMPLSCYWHIPVKKKFCDLGLHSCSLTSVVAWYAPGMLLSCYRQITGYTKKYSKLGLHSCSLSSVLVWYATVMLLTHCRLKKNNNSDLGLHSCSLSSVLVWYATVMLLTHCRLKKQQQWPRPALIFTEQCASLVCHCHATDTLQVKKTTTVT